MKEEKIDRIVFIIVMCEFIKKKLFFLKLLYPLY